MRKTPESCSVSLKPSTQRETFSDQSTAGFSVSDAFRLLDQKGKVQIKHENGFTGEIYRAHSWRGGGSLRRMGLLQNVASNPGRLASYVLDNNTNSVPIIRSTSSVSVVSSSSQFQRSDRMCKCCPCCRIVPKRLDGNTKIAKEQLSGSPWNFPVLPSTVRSLNSDVQELEYVPPNSWNRGQKAAYRSDNFLGNFTKIRIAHAPTRNQAWSGLMHPKP